MLIQVFSILILLLFGIGIGATGVWMICVNSVRKARHAALLAEDLRDVALSDLAQLLQTYQPSNARAVNARPVDPNPIPYVPVELLPESRDPEVVERWLADD